MADGSSGAISQPEDRSVIDLLWPYLTPYLVYVSISSVPESILSSEWAQVLKLIATAAVLIGFRKVYRFGPLQWVHMSVSLLALPVALLSWIGPFFLLEATGLADVIQPTESASFSTLYFFIRVVNSVVLVAIFEELFVRVYIMGWLGQAETHREEKGIFGAIVDSLDDRLEPVQVVPVRAFSVCGATIVFTAGHHSHEYLSAVLYFLFTTWLYRKTGSLWVCILIHGLTNLSIACMVRYAGMAWLW